MSQRGRGGGGDADDIAPAGGRAVLTVPTTIPSALGACLIDSDKVDTDTDNRYVFAGPV
ncbi:hypothetical protein V490_01312, partial [Pseudogymnoascus sp. VKM F-3557]